MTMKTHKRLTIKTVGGGGGGDYKTHVFSREERLAQGFRRDQTIKRS